MRSYLSKSSPVKLILACLLLLAAIIIHSCKKDSKAAQPADTIIAKAKAWYESAYLSATGTPGKLITQSTGPIHDLSQWIKPDWQQTSGYKRFGKSVIEMPIDPSAKFSSALKIGKNLFNKTYTRSYFLLLNDGQNYYAYIMTIIADSLYVGNDMSKLARNSYRKHDPDFSGMVLYFTPKGAYLEGYAYQHGQLVAPAQSAQQQAGNQKVQSVDGNLKTDKMVEVCTDYYIVYFKDGVYQSDEYLTTICDQVDDGTGGAPPAGSPPPPPPCQPVTPPKPPVNVDVIGGGHLVVNFIPPPTDPGDGGMPPPNNNPCPPAVVVKQDIIDDLTNPCLKAVLQKLKGNNLNGKIADIINNVFGSSININLTFQENDAANAGPNPAVTALPTISGNTYNEAITLNLAQVKDASEEFKTIIMIHEILHGYMNYNNEYFGQQLQQHKEMAQKYVKDIETFVKGLYPSISEPDAYSIILNGMADVYKKGKNDSAYISLLNSYGAIGGQATYELQRAGIQGTPCSN